LDEQACGVTEFLKETLASINPATAAKLGKVIARSFGALRDLGYDIEISTDLSDLADFRIEHANHPDCYSPYAAYEAAHHPEEMNAKGLFLLKDGRRVGTLWHRIIPLVDSYNMATLTLRQAFEGKHIFYADPRKAPANETCVADIDIVGEAINTAAVCFVGAAWNHPDHRGMGLFLPLNSLGLVLAITDPEPWGWMLSAVESKNFQKYVGLFPLPSWNRSIVHIRGNDRRTFWLAAQSYNKAVSLAVSLAG
jgi:hypothetical protein